MAFITTASIISAANVRLKSFPNKLSMNEK